MLAYTAGDSLQAITRTYGVDSVQALEEKIRPVVGLEQRRAPALRRPFWTRLFGRRQQVSRVQRLYSYRDQ